ncbi:efflux RND transporter periplasmic adaptor subunit [Carboxylicivirga mesophila]|uniref:Efflux RND transporter periplasmic adaptor subunit n=1 Tax=Carboxylicivirga mesophila TaxID=1166478 RepID=A0ABS5K842_9BACT|nr:efflux RND transporter periplasmic adaptor subunit [Carboxylicivirga mesophila]MBS2211077.1 efflux RND transporter periplasmic adaptor subunit [Carboxylicivirga mesophila]
MNKKTIGILAGVALVAIIIWQPWHLLKNSDRTVTVKKGIIEATVVVTGELKAEKAVDILVPEVSFNDEVDIWAMKILSIVEEGKIVKAGDQVAQLEPTEVEENLASVNEKLNEHYTLVEDAKIDSSLELAAQRETIQKEKDLVLDTKIKVEQSSFESKAVQRQTQIELEKAQRSLSKAQRDLITKTQKHKTKIARNQRKVDRYERKKALLEQLRSELTIKSPADGMIIYGNSYEGQKVKVGSRVGRWMPLIATLPDLSSIISEMYVKEIDIAKVKTGQQVNITIDAFPKEVFKGQIISIANIGQEIPGEFQNGFKVKVKLDDYTAALLPNMTTSNTIITQSKSNTLFIEKSAVRGSDSLKYVFKKSGLSVVRQEVNVGIENEQFFEILQGLDEKDIVLTVEPENAAQLDTIRLQ